MKTLFFVLIVLTMGCSNDEPKITANPIEGHWLFTRISGGIAGINETPKAGEKKILVLNNDGSYYFEDNDIKGEIGKYKLGKKESMLFNKEMDYLELGEDSGFLYDLKGNTLFLIEDYYDGFNYEYHRLD